MLIERSCPGKMIEKNEKGRIRGLNFRFLTMSPSFSKAWLKLKPSSKKLRKGHLLSYFLCQSRSDGTPIFLRQPPIFAAGEINKSETGEWMQRLWEKSLSQQQKQSQWGGKCSHRAIFAIWLFSLNQGDSIFISSPKLLSHFWFKYATEFYILKE